MLTLYFISILAITTNDVSVGWLQWTQPFKSMAECELKIDEKKDQFLDGVKYYLKDKFITAKNIECMTYAEAVKRNTALGH